MKGGGNLEEANLQWGQTPVNQEKATRLCNEKHALLSIIFRYLREPFFGGIISEHDLFIFNGVMCQLKSAN